MLFIGGLGYSWETLCLLLLPQHGANQLGACWLLVLRPEADAPCPEHLRASCSEGYLFLCDLVIIYKF